MTVWDEWNYPCSCFWVSLAPDGIGGEYSDTWTMSIIMKIIMRMMKDWIMGVVMMVLRRIRRNE